MRVPVIAVLFFGLSLLSPASAQPWSEFVSLEDGFTVNFPGEPQVVETTYMSEYGAELPARVYSVARAEERYSMTVVDYGPVEELLTAKSSECPEFDAEITHYMWNFVDLVEGHQLQLTNRGDRSRTFVSIYMHEDRLYILEGTVPAGYPEPGLFQQSLGFVDADGNRVRYRDYYDNDYAPPARVPRGRVTGSTER
jgi:hypothetical protein